jgi:hypothetical protein
MSPESQTPQLKDPELYEKLRDDGASKEKAARISNAAAASSRHQVGRKGGRSGSYDGRWRTCGHGRATLG